MAKRRKIQPRKKAKAQPSSKDARSKLPDHFLNPADCRIRAEKLFGQYVILDASEQEKVEERMNRFFTDRYPEETSRYDRLKAEKQAMDNIEKHMQMRWIRSEGLCRYCQGKNPKCAFCDGLGYVGNNGISRKGQSDYYSGTDTSHPPELRETGENFYTARRENGKFGSFPSTDSYGDESHP